jgi:hypothetical protein
MFRPTWSSSEQANNHNKEQTDKQTRKHKKKTRRKTAQEQNTNEKHAECDNVEKGSEAESLLLLYISYSK